MLKDVGKRWLNAKYFFVSIFASIYEYYKKMQSLLNPITEWTDERRSITL